MIKILRNNEYIEVEAITISRRFPTEMIEDEEIEQSDGGIEETQG